MNSVHRKIIVVFLLVMVIITGCGRKTEKVTKEIFTMGTYITITAYHENPKEAEKIIEQAFKRVKKIEELMSINIEDSEMIRVNRAAGKKPVEVSDDTFKVLKTGLYYSDLTEGKFDITIGPLVKLWNIGFENARIPDANEITKRLPLVNYKMVELNEKEKKVKLEKEGMIIDLGGIAKGYAADAAKDVLLKNGIKHAIINIGGNVLTVGKKPDGSPWKVGIQDPQIGVPRGNYVGIASVIDKTVVTSGNYERYFEKNGKIYHHILDTETGMPARTGIISATIITDNSIDADALSTSVFLLGPQKGLELIKKSEGVEGIIITEDFKVIISPGLKDKFKITNDKFELN